MSRITAAEEPMDETPRMVRRPIFIASKTQSGPSLSVSSPMPFKRSTDSDGPDCAFD